ncbi:MAG: hypothetical protein J2P25_04065 [Nocardiopsaceae bacterium]|nr:hypothetical protein [Nocardiopsaceae bacterium]
MTDNTTSKGEADDESRSALIADDDSPDEQADLTDDEDDLSDEDDDLADEDDDDSADEFTGIDGDGSDGSGVLGAGAVSGGFGFAGLALAVVSLTTNWTSEVMVSHAQYSAEMTAPSSGLSGQQQLDLAESGWHTQGWWAFAFAVAAVLFGVGALLWPRIPRSVGTPAWAKAAATSAIIVGLIGALLAVLTLVGVFGGHLTLPATAG